MSPNFLSLFSGTRKIRKHQKKVQILMLILLFMFLCAFCKHKYMKYLVFIPLNIQCIALFWMNFSYLLFLLGWFCMFFFSFPSHYKFLFQSNLSSFLKRYSYWIDCQHLFIDACFLMNQEIPMQLLFMNGMKNFLH